MTPVSVGLCGHCVHRASACAISDCCIVSTGRLGHIALIQIVFHSFFLYVIHRALFWLFLQIIYVCDIIYDFHFRIEKEHFQTLPCEGGNSVLRTTLLSHQTEYKLLSKQHGFSSKKDGPLLSGISTEGAPCKKWLGLPTAISLDSPTWAVSSGLNPLVFWNRATSSTSFSPECFYRGLFILLSQWIPQPILKVSVTWITRRGEWDFGPFLPRRITKVLMHIYLSHPLLPL